LGSDSLWYKDAIIYELHVRAFQDSDGDGLGDFVGLTRRLDYLQDLGVSALWLLPFYPSPLRDDGYDIADYCDIHTDYGSLADFRRFLDEAHRRGMRVITELVLNHTSDQHPWFQRARRARSGSSARNFYVWHEATSNGDPPLRYGDARIIFPDFEQSNWTWDPVAKAYYWHRFYSHQPDLNFDNPDVRTAILPIVDFWLDMGVDGMRLDAVPYLFEREGTHCENLPETYGFLRELRRHIDAKYEGRMLLAEANQWPEDAAAYFGHGDLCHMAFHFPLMPRLFMALRTEDRFPIIDILAQTPELPENCQWALFLRNHDELTLEMVTDEERDDMNRAYAIDPQARINVGIRRRLAPLLGNDRRRLELMNALLFSLPGTPVVYYGDEIGMGDNVYLGDRDSVRTPMQWSSDLNAGFSRSNPQRLFLPTVIDPQFHFAAVNVEAQLANPHSLLAWMKRLIELRKRHKALSRGDLSAVHTDNEHILAFVRSYGAEKILFVANLSRYPQPFALHPEASRGLVPVELFGRVRFPPFTDQPYELSLGPHSFYWFSLEAPRQHRATVDPNDHDVATITVEHGWQALFEPENWHVLEEVLRPFASRDPGVAAASRAEISDVIPFGDQYFVLLTLDPAAGWTETLLISLAFVSDGAKLPHRDPGSLVCRVRGASTGVLYDARTDAHFGRRLLRLLASSSTLSGLSGQILAESDEDFEKSGDDLEEHPRPVRADQSNTSIVFGESLILKLFRRIDHGIHPDLEIGRFLQERTSFTKAPRVVASLAYRRGRQMPMTLGIVHEFIPHATSAWQRALQSVQAYRQRMSDASISGHGLPTRTFAELIAFRAPEEFARQLGDALRDGRLIGQRTGNLHVALSSVREVGEFAPEPLSPLDQRSLYQSLRNQCGRMLRTLRRSIDELPEHVRPLAQTILDADDVLQDRFRGLLTRRITAQRTRVHGDYHLGQLLWSGDEVWVIDFEGEPGRTLSARRQRVSPLADVASMIWSLHYASITADERAAAPLMQGSELDGSRRWCAAVTAEFLRAYLDAAFEAAFLPRDQEQLGLLFDCILLNRGIHDLWYRLQAKTFEGPAGAEGTLTGLLPLVQASDR